MPDRDDAYVNDDRLILPTDQSYSVPTPVNLAPTYNHNKRFDPETEHQLADYPQFPTNDPYDIAVENQHLDKTFVAYSKEIVQRIAYVPLINPAGGLVIGGPIDFCGIQLWTEGVTGVVRIRDGVDKTAPIVLAIGNNGGFYNQSIGLPGIHFQYGIYIDYTNLSAMPSAVDGSIQIAQDYSV